MVYLAVGEADVSFLGQEVLCAMAKNKWKW